MKPTSITLSVESSVKIKEYQYTKPKVEITFNVEEGDKPGTVMKTARDRVLTELDKLEQDIIKNRGDDKTPVPF